jgi:hypothetical protein
MSNNRFMTKLKKSGNRLLNLNKGEESLYELYKKNLPEGAIVELFLQEVTEDGSLGQLAKVHAMIRDLSLHTGMTFAAMKLEVKKKAGLVLPAFGKPTVKSFGDCSNGELARAIQAAIEVGELVGYPVS